MAQTITHPAISVWSVAAMPNGDIVTGASDGIIRVFSESAERWANEADLKSYDDELARQALPSYVPPWITSSHSSPNIATMTVSKSVTSRRVTCQGSKHLANRVGRMGKT